MQPVLVAPFSVGLDTDTESWMSPADSFSEADNVHIYNGYVEKRNGYRVFGHLKTLDASININNISQAANGVVTTAANHGYSTNDYVLIRSVLGMTQVNNQFFKITVTGLNTFQLNVSTVAYGAYGGGGTTTKVIDSVERVMGIFRFLKSDGTNETLAFGQTRCCKYDSIKKLFFPIDTTAIMSGGENDYIWAINLQSSSIANRLYFTNGVSYSGGLNGIRYYDGNVTNSFIPSLGGTRVLYGGKLLFSLKERLIVLNTYEFDGVTTTTNFQQRARWCQAQGPSNWNDLTPGGGGYVDAPTGDQIVTARALEDQIIVYFTNSVWTLQPTSDPALPFRWSKLNDFRAADGKMASVGYDSYVAALGIRGITATDGVKTQRIDDRIRDFIANEINVNKFDKVYAARSFNERRTWVLYPERESDDNSAALIFDEESNAFTTYSISLNCIGYGSMSFDYAMSDFTAENDMDLAWEDFDDETFQSFFWQGKEELFLGGDITGNIYLLETENEDNGAIISATLTTAGWNPFQSQGIEAKMPYVDIYVDSHKQTKALIEFFKDDDTSPYASQSIDFLPDLGYICPVVSISQANPGVVVAPDHGLVTGNTVYVYGANGMDEVNGVPNVVTVIDANSFSIVDTSAFGAYTGGGSIYKREFYKTKVWKRAFGGGTGYLHKIRISSTGKDCPFRISAFKPMFKPVGRRVVN